MVIERKRHMPRSIKDPLRTPFGMILKRCDGRSNLVFYATPRPFSAQDAYQSPASALKLLLIPLVLYINWEILAPYVAKDFPNPFAPLIFISHYIPTSSPDDPRY